MKQSAGFTMVELVMVIIILGILAAVAMPRMSGLNDFKAQAFYDGVINSLRFAQKTATSHRRLVCVTFTTSTVTLRIAELAGAVSCDYDLSLPAGGTVVQSEDTGYAVFNSLPAVLYFQSDGRATSNGNGSSVFQGTLPSIAGRTIKVEGTTGYVR